MFDMFTGTEAILICAAFTAGLLALQEYFIFRRLQEMCDTIEEFIAKVVRSSKVSNKEDV